MRRNIRIKLELGRRMYSSTLPLIKREGGVDKFAGVYVITNLITGEQYVGSGIQLYPRFITYLNKTNFDAGKRKVGKSIKAAKLENLKVDFMLLNQKVKVKMNLQLYN